MLTEGFVAGVIGAATAGLVSIIGALFKRNQNRKDQYEHEEQLIKLSKDLTNTNKILKDFTSLSRDFDYVKKGMNELHKEIGEVKREVGIVKSNCAATDTMLLRREITNIYLTYFNPNKEVIEIPERDFESALNLYTVYKSLGGNSLVEQYINEIKTWRRI